jgi:hypothetical protein
MAKTKFPITIILISLLFTFLTYLTSVLNKSIIDTFTGIFLLAFPQAKENFLKTDFFYYVPNFFTVFIWALIGILCYLFYYSVAVVYYHLHDYILARFFFVHTGPALSRDLTPKKRLIAHAIVIFLYLLVVMFFLFCAFPISILIYKEFNFFGFEYTSLILTFCLWFFIFFYLGAALTLVKRYLDKDEFKEAHIPSQFDDVKV